MLLLTGVFALIGILVGIQVGYSIKVAKLGKTADYSYKRFWATMFVFFLLVALFGKIRSSLPQAEETVISFAPAAALIISFLVSVRLAYQKTKSP